MFSFDELIVPMEKSERLKDGEKTYSASPTDVRTSPPLVRLNEWVRYRLLMTEYGDVKVSLAFREPTNRSEFKLRVVSEVKLSDDDDKLRILTRWRHSEGGLADRVQRKIAEAMLAWQSDERPEKRLLAAVLESISCRGEGLADVDRAVVRALRDCGLKTDFARVTPVPWLAERSIDLAQNGLNIRLSDHDVPLNVNVSGELVPDGSTEALYFSQVPAQGPGDSIKTRVLDAIRRALGGTTLQDWKSGSPDLLNRAKQEARKAAGRLGWSLGDGLLLRSDVETVVLSENFKFEESYSLPGAGRKLTIEHNGAYRLENAARFEQLKKTQPECGDFRAFVIKQARAVTERKLQSSGYGEAIRLLRDNSKFESDIRDDLAEIVGAYGHSCSSCHVVVKNLPELPLLHERGHNTIIFGLKEFNLAVHSRKAQLGLRGRLKLKDAERLEPAINEKDGIDDIIAKVAETATTTVQGSLNNIKPEVFRLSDLSGSYSPLDEDIVRKHEDSLGDVSEITIKALQKPLAAIISAEILDVYGLELSDVAFEPGEDPVQRREDGMTGYKGRIVVEDVGVLSQADFRVRPVSISILYSVVGKSELYESTFADGALFYEEMNRQIEELELDLVTNLRNLAEQSRYELLRGKFRPRMFEIFARCLKGIAERNHGLDISIAPSSIESSVPRLESTMTIANMNNRIEELELKLNETLDLRGRDPLAYDDHTELVESLTKAIEDMTERRKKAREAHLSIDANEDAVLALPDVQEALHSSIQSMRLAQNARLVIEQKITGLIAYDATLDAEETNRDEDSGEPA
ncbi:MAG: hypothetical protein AAGA72_05270 [Pseudomonadota bacterium]